MNPGMVLMLVVLFPVACLAALLGLDWLEDSLMRSIGAEQRKPKKVVEMPVRRGEARVEPAPAAPRPRPRHRLEPSRAAS